MSTVAVNQSQNTIGRDLGNAAIAGLISAVINVIIFFVGSALVGGIQVATTPGAPYAPLPFFVVAIASFVPTLVAGVGLWISRRFIPRGVLVFQITAAVVTLLSLASPFSDQVATTGAGVVLAITHLVVGGVMIWYMTLRN